MGGLSLSTIWDKTKDFGATQLKPWQGSGTLLENLAANSTPIGGYRALYGDPKAEADKIKEIEEGRAAKETADKQAADKAAVAADEAAAAAKIAADKARAEEEAAKAATLLAKRRRASSPYGTSPVGLLGSAPTTRKTLLGG
jgi:hypothetical protein